MKKEFHDPFNGSDTHIDSTLPLKGIGLTAGTVGERRGGKPRTEEEREERHKEVMDDSSTKGEFIEKVIDGRTHYRRKGYEDAEIPPPGKTIKEQWEDHHAKRRK